jgi:tetratricopeptide (TPR) repeat protein
VKRAILPLLLALAGRAAGADEAQFAKLRAAIELPRVSLKAGVVFNDISGQYVFGENEDPAPKIEALEAALRKDGPNADRLLELACLYGHAHKAKEARVTCARAIELYRQRLRAKPADALALCRLGSALHRSCERDEVVEPLLRRAVQLGPNEPECWASLADFLHIRACLRLLGDKSTCNLGARLNKQLTQKKITPEAARRSLEEMAEALVCLDRAVQAGPGKAESYTRRANVRLHQASSRAAARLVLGLPPSPPGNPPECLADHRTAARLRPDATNLANRELHEFFALLQGGEVTAQPASAECWRQLPERARAGALDTLKRLEQLGKGADRQEAARAHEMHGMLLFFLKGDLPAAEASFRSSVALEPRRDGAWNMLLPLYFNRPAELLKLCLGRLQARPCASNHLLAAKAYDKLGNAAQVEAQLEAAVKLEPDHLLANLALVAVLLRRSGRSDFVRADQLLTRVEARLKDEPRAEEQHLRALLRGTYHVLLGQTEQGLALWKTVRGEYEEQVRRNRACLGLAADAAP